MTVLHNYNYKPYNQSSGLRLGAKGVGTCCGAQMDHYLSVSLLKVANTASLPKGKCAATAGPLGYEI